MHLYKRRFRLKGPVATVAVFIAVIVLFAVLLGQTGERASQEQADLLESAIRNAAVSAYATEGRYPATLDKIVEQYGIVIDAERFIVYYDIFADNIMPSITIITREEVGG